MKKQKFAMLMMVILALVLGTIMVYAAEVVIDDFSQNSQTSLHEIQGDIPITVCTYRSPISGTLGNHRDVCIDVLSGNDDSFARFQVSAITANQYMVLALDPSVTARAYAQWDGVNDTSTIDPTGLGAVDLTDSGLNDGILVRIINSDGLPVDIIVRLYTNATNWAQSTRRIQTTVPNNQVVDLFFPFSGFSGGTGTMNPASIGAVEVELDATIEAGADLTVKLIKASSLWDFGDLPDAYGTLLASDGARHRTTTGLRLGVSVDAEGEGIPSTTATGDDTNYAIGTTNDEDGVVRGAVPNGINGGWANGLVSAGNGGRLDITITGGSGVPQVFMDFGDGNGMVEVTLLNNLGASLSTTPWTPGTYPVYFDIPAGTFDGTNNRSIPTRVRLSSAGELTSTGPAPDGEVEDYIWGFGPTAVSLQSFSAANSSSLPVYGLIGFAALAMVGVVALVLRRERKQA